MALPDFRHINRFRVPFCDVDMLQHVNHASYVVWAETARCTYFDEVLKESLTGPSGIILARLEFEYEQPLDYCEEVTVGCRISRMGKNRSISPTRFGVRAARYAPRVVYRQWWLTTMRPSNRSLFRSAGAQS